MENLDEAIVKYLDGEMSASEEKELVQAIKKDPQGQEKLTFLSQHLVFRVTCNKRSAHA